MEPPIRHIVPLLMLLLSAAAVSYWLDNHPLAWTGWPADTQSTPAQIQIDELALSPGDVFRGRSIVLLEMDVERPIGWGPTFFPILFFDYRQGLGYDFMNDARAAGVPVANEYGHWISPPMLTLLAASFYDNRDKIDRASQVPRVFRPNLARLMGVALVVSDAPIAGETKLFEGMAGDHPLFIHRVEGANVGQFSPTRVVIASDAHEILDWLQAPDFDGRTLAVLEAPLANDRLVSAENVTVRLDKGPVIRIEGGSGGTSLVVLPFDWSHCLQAGGEGFVDLVPANLAQTGLFVEGQFSVEIVYRFGLTAGTECRHLDRERARALDLEDAATGRLFHDARE